MQYIANLKQQKTYWWHVVWCPHKRLGKTSVMLKDPGQAEVTKLDIVICIQEYIGRLQVSVKDGTTFTPPMALLQGNGQLLENLPRKALLQEFSARKRQKM